MASSPWVSYDQKIKINGTEFDMSGHGIPPGTQTSSFTIQIVRKYDHFWSNIIVRCVHIMAGCFGPKPNFQMPVTSFSTHLGIFAIIKQKFQFF